MLHVDENPLINGCFDAADDTTSLTAAGKIATVWELLSLGSSGAGTISIQSLVTAPWAANGLPTNLTKFLRWAQTTAATAGTPAMIAKIPGVQTFAGKLVTFQGFYRANQAVTVQLRQMFGTGGSPTTTVEVGTAQTLPSTLDSSGTAQWTPFSISATLPTIVGLTLGTTAATSYVGIRVIGVLSTTFQLDMTDVRLVRGGARDATVRRPAHVDVRECARQYSSQSVWAPVSTQSANHVSLPVRMISAPSMTSTGATTGNVTVDGYSIISTGAAAAITVIADSRVAA